MDAAVLEPPPATARPKVPRVTAAGAEAQAEWDAFVNARPEATGYHRWAWRDVFERALGHPAHYLIARADGVVVGVLPLVEVKSWLFGRALSSLPYVNYGGVIADTREAADALLTGAAALARDSRLEYLVLRHLQRRFPELPVRTHKVTMRMDLAPTADAMWTLLDKKVRNQIRKAEKSGVTVVSGRDELVDEFYSVFARNMRDLGTPVYGSALFRQILRAQPEDAHLHVARLNGKVIAGSLTYGYGDVLEVPSASSLREHRDVCPNHALYWSMIQTGIARGVKVFDFGRSTPDDGTYHFKEQWGAAPLPLYWEYQLFGDTALPEEDRHSARLQRRIEAWKKLPLPLTTMLGPRIARCVP
jgi:FemAB-related protein (PEP-CTERM system-associated)